MGAGCVSGEHGLGKKSERLQKHKILVFSLPSKNSMMTFLLYLLISITIKLVFFLALKIIGCN